MSKNVSDFDENFMAFTLNGWLKTTEAFITQLQTKVLLNYLPKNIDIQAIKWTNDNIADFWTWRFVEYSFLQKVRFLSKSLTNPGQPKKIRKTKF